MPTRVMVFGQIKRGNEEAFEAAFAEVTAKVKGTPGHITDELLRHSTGTDIVATAAIAPEDETYTQYIILSLWETRQAFLDWELAPIHMQTTTPMRPYWTGRAQRKIYDVAVRLSST